ncbi:hypothetical protein ADL06_22390 [Streptomyces sp. NRRL F-6491]|nr:hypothetical protein ADL06_22390 [Streptomyces sp. NRRL F-6491]
MNAGPFHEARLASEALPSLTLSAAARAGCWLAMAMVTTIRATAIGAVLRGRRDVICAPEEGVLRTAPRTDATRTAAPLADSEVW